MVKADSEQRLGQTLLQLAAPWVKKDPRSIRIEVRFLRRIVEDGRHDAASDHLLHAEISQPGIDRKQKRSFSYVLDTTQLW